MAAETSQYLRPGTYIGQLIRPAAANITGNPRLPVFVCKGSRLAQAKNTEIVRARVFDEALTFLGAGPYTALLNFQADGVKTNTRIVDSDGRVIPDNEYLFSTSVVSNDTITIPSQFYNSTVTYTITYQSVDRSVQDPVPFADLRFIQRVGLAVDSSDFTEFTDFYIPVTFGAVTADVGNTYTETDAYGSTFLSARTVAISSASPAEDITITALVTGAAGNGIRVLFAGGGALTVVESVASRLVTVTYVSTVDTTTTIVAAIAGAGLTLVSAVGVGATPWVSPAQDQLVVTSQMLADPANTGDGNVYFANTGSEYTHAYDRDYTIECIAGGGTGTADFIWYSSPVSLGNTMQTYNPAHPDLNAVAAFRNLLTNPASDTNTTLENGLVVRFRDLGGVFAVGDKWTFRAFGPSTIEIDSRHTNTNQFTENGAVIEVDVDPLSDGVLTVASTPEAYTGTYNRTYTLAVFAVVAATSVTFKWSAVGDDGVATGTTAALTDGDNAVLDEGVQIDVDLTPGDFVVGDIFRFTISAPRVLTTIKDDRTYTLEVSAAAPGDVDFLFFTSTPEGGIGSFTATTADPHIELAGNLNVNVRNLSLPRYAGGDEFEFALTLDDVIDWTLETRVTETILAEDIVHDILGRVTGVPDTYYAVLRNIPETIISVLNSVPATVAATIVIDTATGDNTRFLSFGATDPADDITVIYQYIGKEPSPGQAYRFSALYLRGAELYNDPILVQSEGDGIALTAPMGTTNHAGIINGIAWDFEPIGIYICQVKDADDDGVYQDSDYETAIEATEEKADITDLVVLDAFGTLNKQLEQIDQLADPFRNQNRLLWIGMPIDTPIGDVDTPDTLVYTAKVTTAVFGDSQSHGSRIMVASTFCDRTIVLDDGTSQSVTLDGSFVAAAACLTYASFGDPWETMLFKNLTVFDDVQVYTLSENNILGAAQINYVERVGDGIFRWIEDVTTDPVGTENAPDEFRIISAMIQKKYMNTKIQQAVDATVISLVPDSGEQGIAAIVNAISGAILTEVSNGKIGQYQNEDGAIRKFNPGSDIRVFRDRTQRTLYRFFVGYFLRYPIKTVVGLALTDSNNFGLAPE